MYVLGTGDTLIQSPIVTVAIHKILYFTGLPLPRLNIRKLESFLCQQDICKLIKVYYSFRVSRYCI